MRLQDFPTKTLRSIFEFLVGRPRDYHGAYNQLVGVMKTCRRFYAVGLPILYEQVILNKIGSNNHTTASLYKAFFKTLRKNGHLVGRIKIIENCWYKWGEDPLIAIVLRFIITALRICTKLLDPVPTYRHWSLEEIV
jgi:hypothetical protein